MASLFVTIFQSGEKTFYQPSYFTRPLFRCNHYEIVMQIVLPSFCIAPNFMT